MANAAAHLVPATLTETDESRLRPFGDDDDDDQDA